MAQTETHAGSHDEFVEQVIAAVTGSGESDLQAEALCQRMEAASREFDRRTAEAFCEALLDRLGDDPSNLRLLEALVILGLAHQEVLEKARISLAVEGRRLAVLLERGGETERARAVLEFLSANLPSDQVIDHELAGLMKRSGETEALVERYLARAEQAVAEGRVAEAIPWLQEVLLTDRNRRDVARMIRDLRASEVERERRGRGRLKLAALLLCVTTLLSLATSWELDARKRFASLPAAGTEAGIESRLMGLEQLAERRPIWTGARGVREERRQLEERRQDRVRKSLMEAEEEREFAGDRGRLAESAWLLGQQQAENGELAACLASLRRALELAPLDWPRRAQAEIDCAALEQHLEDPR